MTDINTAQIGLINFARLRVPGGSNYRFQNFHFDGTRYDDRNWQFVPFGFSGITINRSGENSQAELVFPNNALVRSFVDRAVSQKWTVDVDTCIVADIENKSYTLIYSYTGQASGGTWKGDSLMLSLSSILDAVTANVPLRNFDVDQVGPLPISGNIRL